MDTRFKLGTYTQLLMKPLVELLHSSKLQDPIKFRLVEIDEDQVHVTVQLVGSMKSFRASVQELMRSDLLMSFSKQDAILITHLGTKFEQEKTRKTGFKYLFKKLLPAIYGGKSKIEVENQQGKIEQKPCSDVLENTELVASATDQQKVNIGYIAGYEACKEKRESL